MRRRGPVVTADRVCLLYCARRQGARGAGLPGRGSRRRRSWSYNAALGGGDGTLDCYSASDQPVLHFQVEEAPARDQRPEAGKMNGHKKRTQSGANAD